MADEKWYFTKEQLSNTPSSKCGYDADKELSCRQQAAHLIQDMGQRLQVTQLCINTAMVYMHRFYVFHSFSHFHLDAMAAASLFLAAKVEEQPRKLEHVIRVKQICQHRDQPALDTRSEQYLEQAQDLVFNENVLLQTLGFDVAIDHPHTHVVRCCHLVRASKDLAQTSYFMASNSLHLTTMCLQYKPTVVACFCIHLACKWSNWEIPQSNEGKYWFYYVDRTVTQDLLEQLTDEFLVIFEKCPSKLKKKIKSANHNSSSYQFDKMAPREPMHEGVSFQSHHRPQDPTKPSSSQPQHNQRPDSREFQEKRDRERQLASQGTSTQQRDGHHRSHHANHPHPSSASALLKPHAGAPAVHNKAPHPVPHRSSVPHHPRPDHHGRPEHPQRQDHQARSDHQQRPDYQQRQDRQPRPEHGARPDHHPRTEHPSRPDQVRPDHHQVRPEHQQRGDHQNRLDHPQRPEYHTRPEHQVRTDHHARTDHQLRPDHAASQVRTDQQQRLEPSNRFESSGSHAANQSRSDHQQQRLDPSSRFESSGRSDDSARPEHGRTDHHPSGSERHDRPDGAERLLHPEQRHSAVTAARDQLRREAALQREASRRESSLTLPSNVINHSPAQRTTSGDSAISSSSSTSLTPSQDWSGFGAPASVTGGPPSLAPKHPESSHRHSASYEKPKSSNSNVDPYSRHRSSLPGTDRRLISGSSSSNVNMAGVGSTSNIGIVGASGSGNVKDVPSGKQPSVPYNSNSNSSQQSSMRNRRPHELLNVPPVNREDSSNMSSSIPSLDRKMMQEISERRQLESFFGKTETSERLNEKLQVKHVSSAPFKEVKKEPEASLMQPQHPPMALPNMHIKRERVSPSRQGEKVTSSNLAPPIKIEPDLTSQSSAVQHNNYKPTPSQYPIMKGIKTEPDTESDARNGTPPVKSSIFSPEKTLPKERESPMLQRSSKASCPPSPGIAFGSPPVTSFKSQSASNRNRTASSCSETEPSVDLIKIEKEPGFENVVRDGRADMKNSVGLHHGDNLSQVSSNRSLESRLAPAAPRMEAKPALSQMLNKPMDVQLSSVNPLLQPRNNISAQDERQSVTSHQVPPMSDMRSATPVKIVDNRTSMPTSIEGDLGAVAFPASEAKDLVSAPASEEGSAEHHHHKSKKKKEKKEKHKHRDKDRERDKEKHREEKKHKSKHKEKDKERRKAEAATSELVSASNESKPAIMLKIPKANITPPPPPSGGSLKLKINLAQLSSSGSSSSKESRKRERDRSSPSEQSHPKAPKLSTATDTPKRGGGVSGASSASHSVPSKSSYVRQNGLESRGGGRQPQHYSGNKMVLDGSSMKPSEISKNSSSHSSTSTS